MKIKRNVFSELIKWKNSVRRKPLVLEGARQVGKTWLLKEFGRSSFENYVYFNFDENDELAEIFKKNKNAHRIIERLSLIASEAIKPETTLIIFDEIQECSDALNALKYFNENAKEYCVASAGSLLGTLLAQPKSYPVGQVNLIKVFPLSFDEFLRASDEGLFAYYTKIQKNEPIEQIFHTRLTEMYQNYLIIGGLPECVLSWVTDKDPKEILRIQEALVSIYEKDFAKHNGKVNAGRILMVFRNIASQLAKENKKFIYGNISSGARAREFEEAIEWLVSAGMVNRVYLVSKNEHPLKAFCDLSTFKLYLFDTGLLKFMAGVGNDSIVLDKDYQFKGAIAENYVLQQLKAKSYEPHYFSFERFETDLLLQLENEEILPVEIKSGDNVKSASMRAYKAKYSPKRVVRYSMLNYTNDGDTVNIPLYLAGRTLDLI